MKVRYRICFLLCLLWPATALPQYGKGVKLYEKHAWKEAIPLFKKSLKGRHAKDATAYLAHSLLLVKNYPESESFYRKLMAMGKPRPEDHLHFGLVLLNNGNYREAEEQFNKYLQLAPGDRRATLLSQTAKTREALLDEPPGFEVKPVGTLNTNGSQFSPLLFNNGIMFPADKAAYYNYVKRPDPKTFRNNALNLFTAPFIARDSMRTGEWEPVSRKINTGLYNGPATTDKKANILVYSQVPHKPYRKQDAAYPVLMQARKNGTGWDEIDLIFSPGNYAITHPALSPDGKTLYFASDMPGGSGGYDIYRSKLNGNTWSKPENLGTAVNTPFNETFPYYSGDGLLYFSSDGHAGLGGLDIFVTEELSDGWQQPVNLLGPLNSTADDFGIVFSNDYVTGYFSSNRDGVIAGDNIYRFRQLAKSINIAGQVLTGEKMDQPVTALKLQLIDYTGKVVREVVSGTKGEFKFENLPDRTDYTMQLAESKPDLPAYNKVYIANKEGIVYKKATTDNSGLFTFYNLPVKGPLDGEIEDDTRITVSGSLLAGESPAKPLAEQTVYLTDTLGNVVAEGVTDAYGNFKFEHLPPDANFLVSLDPQDTKLEPNTRIVVTDNKGKTINTFYTDAAGSFKFEVLASENTTLRMLEEENTSLRIDLKGKLYTDESTKAPLPNSTVQLVDERGVVVQTVQTDAQGNFHFTNLPSDVNYMVNIAESDVPVNVDKLFVADDKGMVIRKLLFDRGGFKFDILPSDQKVMASIYVEDPWLKIKEIEESKKDTVTVIENIYYEYGKFDILPEAQKILDRVVGIMNNNPDIYIELSSHTDSRSSAEFNLELSRKRAKAAVDYIISKGITSARITGVGFGEESLVNYCADGVECNEEQHAQNRRTEFKIVRLK